MTFDAKKIAGDILDAWCMCDNGMDMDRKLQPRIAHALNQAHAQGAADEKERAHKEALAEYEKGNE